MSHPKGTGVIYGEVIVERDPISNSSRVIHLPLERYWRGELAGVFGPRNVVPLFGEIDAVELIAHIESHYERTLSPEDKENLTAFVKGEAPDFTCKFKLMEH